MNFKEGDRVKVIDCKEIRNWDNWEKVVDKIFTLTKKKADELNRGDLITLEDNKYCINFTKEMFIKANYQLQKGDRVKIRKDSKFYGQSHAVGTIGNETSMGGKRAFHVDFDDGYGNTYNEEDLTLRTGEER